MNKRPKIQIKLSKLDIIIEVISVMLIVAIWIITFKYFPYLPEEIPIHFNLAGIADNYGSKTSLFMLPTIATLMFVGLTVINRYPHLHKYQKEINTKNAPYLYEQSTRLVRILKLSITLLFGLLVIDVIMVSVGYSNGFGIWFLPFTIAIIFIPIIYYSYCSSHKSK